MDGVDADERGVPGAGHRVDRFRRHGPRPGLFGRRDGVFKVQADDVGSRLRCPLDEALHDAGDEQEGAHDSNAALFFVHLIQS